MLSVFLHFCIFEELKIKCAELLHFWKKNPPKMVFKKKLNSSYFLLGGRRNMIFSLFWEARVEFLKNVIWLVLSK